MTDPAPATALDGLRVVEIGEGQTLAYAGKLLAEYGADVVKLEDSQGDPLRRRLPLPDAPHADGALHRWLNNNKRSLVLDWRNDAAALAPLLSAAGIVLSAVPRHGPDAPPTAAALAPQALRRARAHLIVGHASDFGPDGPLRDWQGGELALYALSGLLGASGPHDRPPLAHGVGVSWLNGGAALAMGVLAANWERATSGLGQVVDVAGLDTMVSAQGVFPFLVSYTGVVDRRQGKVPSIDQGIFQCADGAIACVIRVGAWESFLDALDHPPFREERFRRRGAMYRREIVAEVAAHLRTLPRRDVLERAQAKRLPFALAHTAADLAGDAQLADRGFFLVAEGADGRHTRIPGRPFLMGASPWRMHRPAPLLGDTTQDSLDWDPHPQPPAPPTTPAVGALPLAGLRVVELGTAWAVPFAARALADLGAHVIKLESPRYPDHGRIPPYTDFDLGDTFYDRLPGQLLANPNKFHAALDFARPRGRELLLRLVAACDIVIENYTPHALQQHRLTYDDLRAVNPRLIMLSSCGYGHSGPWRDYRALGWGLEPASGLADVTGYPDGPPEASAVPYPDIAAAVHAAFACMLALEHRRRTGDGQWIDLAQYEVATLSAAAPLLHHLSSGGSWGRHGNRHPWYAPHNLYPAAPDGTPLGNDDQWLTIAVEHDREWLRLLAALHGALPDHPAWRALQGRKADEDDIDAAIADWTRQRTAQDAARHLQSAGVRAAPVRRFDQVLRDPQLWHRGLLLRADQPAVGPRIVAGPWQRFSRTPARLRWAAAPYGAHNDLVYRGLLGLDDKEMADLERDGVIGPLQMPRPRRAGTPLDRQIEQGRARGADPDHRAWNAAAPPLPYDPPASLVWGPHPASVPGSS